VSFTTSFDVTVVDQPILTTMPTSHFHYVYILWDASTHTHFYVGHTSDLAARLKTHNAGHVPHTSKYAPWEIHSAIAVQTEEQASELEKYFKSHSGREWVIKHLGSSPTFVGW
ncbi:MAG: GIY-YIG nuclease family protein, partial [Akkermansia sp.]|nr:GIY-YIG nuclease family protein [Akkermansia sp.]